MENANLDAISAVTDQARPIPPHYWWLKRISLAAVLVVAALGGFRLWWGWDAERRLRAELERRRVAGELLAGECFDPPPIAKDENAAPLYMAAAQALTLRPPGVTLDFEIVAGRPEFCAEYPAEVECLVAANQNTLALLREARARPRVDWGVRLRKPLACTAYPLFSSLRQMVKLQATALMQAQQQDNHAEVAEILRDMLAMGRKVDEMQGGLSGHMFALLLDRWACAVLEWVAPILAIDEDCQSASQSNGPASRTQVQALLADLLNEASLRKNLLWGALGERAIWLDYAEFLTDNPAAVLWGWTPDVQERLRRKIVRPRMRLNTIQLLREADRQIEAVRQTNWPDAAKFLPPGAGKVDGISFLCAPTEVRFVYGDRAIALHFYGLADRRMAAIALALRLYELDHGRRPAALNELVPDYLPAVPVDPFAADGRALAYRLDNPDHPCLYSVGYNGIDEGGAFALTESGGLDLNLLDLPFFLDGHPPRAPMEFAVLESPSSPPVMQEEDQESDDEENP